MFSWGLFYSLVRYLHMYVCAKRIRKKPNCPLNSINSVFLITTSRRIYGLLIFVRCTTLQGRKVMKFGPNFMNLFMALFDR